MDYIIHFVAKLLEPTGTESEALFVGDLIVTMIQKVRLQGCAGDDDGVISVFFYGLFLTTIMLA